MFLEKANKKFSEDKVIKDILVSKKIISDERVKIGQMIQDLVSKDLFTNIEIVENIHKATNYSKNTIRNMLEEYKFKLKFNIEQDLNINEIKLLKFGIMENLIKEKDIKEDFETVYSKLDDLREKQSEKRFQHSFTLDEESEILFNECKSILEEELGRSVKSKGEFITLVMSSYMANSNF